MAEEKKKKWTNKGQREGDIKTIQWLCGGVPMANKARNVDYFCQSSRQISFLLPPLPHSFLSMGNSLKWKMSTKKTSNSK